MGCGPSRVRIGIKSTNKRKVKDKFSNGSCTIPPNESEDDSNLPSRNNDDIDGKKKQRPLKVPPIPNTMLVHNELTQSQLEFFRALDEKIENAPDYESDNETLETIQEHRSLLSKSSNLCWDSPKRHEPVSRHYSAGSATSDKASEKTSYRTALSSWNNTSLSEEDSSEINNLSTECSEAKKIAISNGSIPHNVIGRIPTLADVSLEE